MLHVFKCVFVWVRYAYYSDSFNHLAHKAHVHFLPHFREHVTWFDLWSFGTRCLQLVPKEAYVSAMCVCVCFYTFNKNLCLSYLITFVFSFPVLCWLPFFSHLLLSFWQPVISPPSVFSVTFVHKQGLCAFLCPDQCFHIYLWWFEFHYYFKRNRNICQFSKQCIAQKGLWEIHMNIQ